MVKLKSLNKINFLTRYCPAFRISTFVRVVGAYLILSSILFYRIANYNSFNAHKQYNIAYHILLLSNNILADVQATVLNSLETRKYSVSSVHRYNIILMDIRRFLFLYAFHSFLLYVTVLFFNGEPSGLPGPLCTAF